jgi:hypothetical protein
MKTKAISYSLFGYDKPQHQHSFDFNSYLRGLMINVRMNRLLYPEWEIVLETDKSTYEGFKDLFDKLKIVVHVNDPAPLCLAMLWRLKPVYEQLNGKWKYSHVICRDLDSPPTYREVQAVQYWINRDKALHAITDSISHKIPLLGGMIGIRPDHFTLRMPDSWDKLIALGSGIDYTKKGSDQIFLERIVYPKFASHGTDSITQHYFNGMPDTFLSDYRTCTCAPTAGHESHCYNNTEVDLPFELAESNSVAGHIGAAGYYETSMFKFLRKHWDKFGDLVDIEKNYPKIFYWNE